VKDVFRKTGFVLDARVFVADDATLPNAAFFVSAARFRAERETLKARGPDVGLVLEPDDRLDDLVADLAGIGAIAVRFPKFTDGRGCSLARLLRERHGYRSELRAIGDILWDQLEALCRCGFDTIEVEDATTRRRLERGERPAMPVRYQPVGGDGFVAVQGRPWASAAWADAWCGA
jgi:phosphoadenosine phosphosulfate reductase